MIKINVLVIFSILIALFSSYETKAQESSLDSNSSITEVADTNNIKDILQDQQKSTLPTPRVTPVDILIQNQTDIENVKYLIAQNQDIVTNLITQVNQERDRADWQTNTIAKTIERTRSHIGGAGVFQIIAGVVGLIVTISDANMKEETTAEIPTINSKGKLTTEKEKITVKHKWCMSHTTSAILSGGFIISGIITVSF